MSCMTVINDLFSEEDDDQLAFDFDDDFDTSLDDLDFELYTEEDFS